MVVKDKRSMLSKANKTTNHLIKSIDFNRFYYFKKTKQPIKTSNPTMRKILLENIELYFYIKHLIKIHNLELANKLIYNDKTIQELKTYQDLRKNHKAMLKEAERIKHSIEQKQYRLHEAVKGLIDSSNDYCLFFATFTFQDNVFQRLNALSRRKMITRIIKKNAIRYIGNIDYGKLNEREHYHFLIATKDYESLDKIRQEYNQVFCSAMNYENITIRNSKAISKYIGKLTNHALKQSTRAREQYYSHLIYSKNITNDIRHAITTDK